MAEGNTASSELVVQFENRCRQQLGIGDCSDPEEFAGGLLRNYDDEAQALELEEVGLPFTRVRVIAPAERATGSSLSEIDKAIDDVERDLETLSRDVLLKDIDIELQAWGTAIRAIIAEGLNAAALALDPRERDRAFAARRALGNYARLARYVGVLTQGANQSYRQLAQSLDVVASLILVVMGESLAAAGARAGQFLLQAPAGELQERRDAVVFALRTLVGRSECPPGDGWPRGTEAYRRLLERLAEAGHTDLRALLREESMAQMLNQLVDIAAGNDPSSLRGLAATGQVLLERFHRLVHFGQMVQIEGGPQSPQLASLLSALSLFVNAFENTSSGSRLLYVARPVILSYGHYGIGGPTPAVRYLQDVIADRGCLAELLDCYLDCRCDENSIRCQVMLDKALYDVDRAIDLYSLGTDIDADGNAEHRAGAYGALALAFWHPQDSGYWRDCPPKGAVAATLRRLAGHLGWDVTNTPYKYRSSQYTVEELMEVMEQELCMQWDAEQTWENLVRRMAPACRQPGVFGSAEPCGERGTGVLLVKYLIDAAREIVRQMSCDTVDEKKYVGPNECPEYEILITEDLSVSTKRIADNCKTIAKNVKEIADKCDPPGRKPGSKAR